MAIKITQADFEKKFGSSVQAPQPQQDNKFVDTSFGSAGRTIAGAFQSGVGQIRDAFSESRAGRNPIETGAKFGAGVVNAAFSPLSPLMKPVTGAIDSVSNTVANNKRVQDFAMSNTGERVARGAEFTANLSALAGTSAGFAGAPRVAQGVAGRTRSAIDMTTPDGGSGIGKLTIDSIDNLKRRITAPEVSDATRVSLNPKKALSGVEQNIQVSVGGKLKKLSELTPEENTQMQLSTEKSVASFTKQAELFKNNRNPLNDPTEIVGQRVDNALTFADKKRQAVGRKMGAIEEQYGDVNIPIAEGTTASFVDTIKSFDNPKYGVDTADAPIIRKLVADYDRLGEGGSSVAERMDFVRSWDKYLNDSKDAFGNFKENATVNTRIQNAVRALKEETVEYVASKDPTYRGLRTQYRTYKVLDEIGNALLGKDGALGDRIKGGATVKRALKSNSDAGARQFLVKLKEITGYDALKDGDLALTAMESVGDFQGLSLLEVLNDGKGGLIRSALEKVQNVVVGDNATRIKKFIKNE